MSKLLVDIGNTRSKFTTCDTSGKLDGAGVAVNHTEIPAAWQRMARPESIWIASVASKEINNSVQQLCEQLWGIKPQFMQSTSRALGVTNIYNQPERLGIDRWLAMIAAYDESKKAVLVADAGSALTIDAIDSDGKHLGGWFVPGTTLACQALADAANFKVELSKLTPDEASVFGTSSEQGMLKGAIRSAAALIDQAYVELQNIQSDSVCYLTGGDAVKIQDALQCPYIYDESLVLKGLALMATRV